MSDLDMIRACAEMMGCKLADRPMGKDHNYWRDEHNHAYNPLTNKAQACELVEKLHLACHPPWSDKQAKWRVNDGTDCIGSNTDLCRAIVECVAAMKGKK